MKSIIFLLSLFIPSLLLAQTLEYEVIRTEESPGFFAVRLFPGKDLAPEYLEDVFVKNFRHKTEAQNYTQVIEELENIGAKVLSPEDSREFLFDQQYRIVILGGENIEGFLQFKATEKVSALDEFATFTKNYLGPIYLKDITADFGGNISEVVPDKVPYLNQQASYFIGKFEKPMKTRMGLNAYTTDGEFAADFPLDLSHYQENEIAAMLPTLWEKIQKEPLKQVTKISQTWILNAFPLLLGLTGLLLILISLRQPYRSRSQRMEDLIDENFWNTPIEETPLYKEWEQNLPFENK